LEKTKISNYDLQVDIGRQIFLQYDQDLLIRKFHLTADPEWIYLTYLNVPYRICRKSGRIEESSHPAWQECRSYNTVMTIYDLLCFHKGETAPVLLHQWCSVGNFIVTGIQDTGKFTHKYAAAFQDHIEELKEACQRLGGIPQPPMAGADVTYQIPVTSFFPILFQFWEGDEEFPPKLMILWDRNADRFLHFETTFYLQGDLLERISQIIPKLS